MVTPPAQVRARQIALATNAYPAPLRRLHKYVVPVYDHVLVTEPLTDEQWAGLGWPERQGVTDAGNQFHYYRPLADGRILWGGYDAIYYYGSSTDAAREQRDASHRLLAGHFVETFPQLDGRAVHPPLGGADRHLEPVHAVRRRRPSRRGRLTPSASPGSASPTAGSPPARCSTCWTAGRCPAF